MVYHKYGDIMNKYYLFIIDNKFVKNYKNKSYVLYKLLETLYNSSTYDFCYGTKIYWQLCNNFSTKLLHNYINTRLKNIKINEKIYKLQYEKTYIQIMYPCVIIYTNRHKSAIFKIFNIYNRNIFVCNFAAKDYFWLNNYLKDRQI